MMIPLRKSLSGVIIQFVLIYFAIGFAISVAQNVWGAIAGGPSAFVWTGSLKGNMILLFWWFIVPSIIWPIDLYWMIYHLE